MRFGLPAHAFAATMWLAGCALIAGIDDGDDKPAPIDASALDRVVQPDGSVAPVDSGACSAKELPETTIPEIARVVPSAPVIVDGSGKEWSCVDRMVFLTGNRRVDIAGGRGVARIALQHDDEAIYVWAVVTTATPSGTAAANANFRNDSFHLYAMGPAPTAEYTGQDHHVVVDALGLVTDYSDVAGIRPTLEGIVAKASMPVPAADPALQTFEVELRITAKTLGRVGFQAGDRVRMNFQINDGPPAAGKNGPGYRVWFLDTATCPPTADCDVLSNSEPYCNPRCTRELTLK
ncbi:MAG: hypothetical protein JST00_01095 [Deltaproteobacteria bacterium]|nr:hypothetical protein [Deltaproteobacteria bacterium]